MNSTGHDIIRDRFLNNRVNIVFHFIRVTLRYLYNDFTGRRDRMVVDFTTTVHVQSVFIINKIVSSNPAHCQVYLIKHYVIKFLNDLRLFGCFLRVLQ
jgi:hypothetical protein